VGTSAACGLPISVAGAIGFLVFGQFVDADKRRITGWRIWFCAHMRLSVCNELFYRAYRTHFAPELPSITLKNHFAVLLLV
jgi:hypothetical protein